MAAVARERIPAAATWTDAVQIELGALTEALVARFSGRVGTSKGRPVTWSVGEERVSVQSDRLRVTLRPGLLVVDLPLAPGADGRPLTVATAFRVGQTAADATLDASPEERALGDARLGGRWSALVAEVAWVAVLEIGAQLVDGRSTQRAPLVLGGVFTDGVRLSFVPAARFRETGAVLPPPPARR